MAQANEGAISGAASGAAAGAAFGPPGMIAGALIGGFLGFGAGKAEEEAQEAQEAANRAMRAGAIYRNVLSKKQAIAAARVARAANIAAAAQTGVIGASAVANAQSSLYSSLATQISAQNIDVTKQQQAQTYTQRATDQLAASRRSASTLNTLVGLASMAPKPEDPWKGFFQDKPTVTSTGRTE